MIPARLGRSSALDDAVKCLCSLFSDFSRRAASVSSASYRLYGRSLQSLRRSLNIPQARTVSETICASIILQLCELIMHAKGGRWNQLCQGTKLLVQESGPGHFVHPFERAMLESQRAWFIVQDADLGQECFLSRQEWRVLLSSPGPREPASISLRSQLCDFLVDVPGLLKDVSNVISRTAGIDLPEAQVTERRQKVVHQLVSLKQTFEWWYHSRVAPLRSISDAIYSKEMRESHAKGFGDDGVLLAVVDCVSNSVMIKLDALLFNLANNSEATTASSFACQGAIAGRRKAMSNALSYVWEHSSVALKPLEFGLQRLWLDTAFDSNPKTSLPQPSLGEYPMIYAFRPA